MKHRSLLSKLKREGLTNVNYDRGWYSIKGTNGKSLSWTVDDDGDVSSLHSPSEHTDIMTDCHCDYYPRTLKAAIRWITRD